MKKIEVLIIDDEILAIDAIKNMVDDFFPEGIVIGSASSIREGIRLIQELNPDLIFLDIEMPKGTGLDLLNSLTTPPLVVITTAHPQYAIPAIKMNVLDYLLKPISITDFLNTTKRVKNRPNLPKLYRIAIPLFNGYRYISLQKIILIKASQSYSEIFLHDQEILVVSKNLKHYENSLSTFNFFRTHKSYLINLQHVKSFSRSNGGYLNMSGGYEVPISKHKRIELFQILNYLL